MKSGGAIKCVVRAGKIRILAMLPAIQLLGGHSSDRRIAAVPGDVVAMQGRAADTSLVVDPMCPLSTWRAPALGGGGGKEY